MSNQLSMAKVSAIQALAEEGWSRRRISRELGIHRETVGRYVQLARAGPNEAQAEPARVLTGSVGSTAADAPNGTGSEPAKVLTGSRSRCDPLRGIIVEKIEQGLSAQRIWQDLHAEHGFTGGYHSVQRYVLRLTGTSDPPFRRMECAPGEEAQVDFGTGAAVVTPDGRRRRTHVFRIVLSHSRKGYSEAVFRQTTDDFIRCLENAFAHFGGVPKTLVIDNLRAAVTKADWFDPELNPKAQAFCEHCGTVILPTRPYTPRHKGKVERGIAYVKANALKGRTFAGLAEQNRHLAEWERGVADTRIHGTTRRQVRDLFERIERPALRPLPPERFPCFTEAQRTVHRDGHVEVDRAYYSVPPEHVGRRVWVRWDTHMVRILSERMRPVATHARVEHGRFSTRDEHIVSEKIAAVERGAAWLLDRTGLIGPHARRWAEAMMGHRGIEGVRVVQGLHNLGSRHESDAIERACRVAHSHGAYRLRDVRALIERQGDEQDQFEFTQEHPIIRDLSEYGRLITGAAS